MKRVEAGRGEGREGREANSIRACCGESGDSIRIHLPASTQEESVRWGEDGEWQRKETEGSLENAVKLDLTNVIWNGGIHSGPMRVGWESDWVERDGKGNNEDGSAEVRKKGNLWIMVFKLRKGRMEHRSTHFSRNPSVHRPHEIRYKTTHNLKYSLPQCNPPILSISYYNSPFWYNSSIITDYHHHTYHPSFSHHPKSSSLFRPFFLLKPVSSFAMNSVSQRQ